MRKAKTKNKDGTFNFYSNSEKRYLLKNATEKEVDEIIYFIKLNQSMNTYSARNNK